jgi:hypothetical protein
VLLQLLKSNRGLLIHRCRAKVAKRFPYESIPPVVAHGIPLFLDQLAGTLEGERLTSVRPSADAEPRLMSSDIGRSAALHGVELLRLGYTIDQVVHHYGDVCQGLAELAMEQHVQISADQFRTLNRCLDEAIADAVTAFSHDREVAIADGATALHDRIGRLAEEERRLIAAAIQTFAAIKTGNIGVSGATGTALVNALYELRDVVDRTLPEVRLATGMTTLPPGPTDGAAEPAVWKEAKK